MSGLDDLYQQVILDHAREKHGFGLQDGAAGSSHQHNPTCGDDLTLQLHLTADGDHVEAIRWEGAGCSISLASASLLSDLAEGMPVSDLPTRIALFRELMHSRGAGIDDPDPLGDASVLEGVSRYAARVKCAMLAWVALEDSLRQASA